MRSVTREELLKTTGQSLGLAETSTAENLIRPALRRAAFFLAPCSRADLIRFVSEPLGPLGVERDVIEAMLEELIAYGDILEMRKLDSDGWDAPSYVLRPAPPSFVRHSNSMIIVLGVSGALPSALTPDLESRLSHHGPIRVLATDQDRSLTAHLKLLGFAELSESAWLRAPAVEAVQDHVRHWVERLAAVQETPGGIANLEILGLPRTDNFYAGRWASPSAATTGTFIARRPQHFGGRLWSFVDFDHGVARRLIDLYEDEERQRPCDIAWRVQAAIDASRGQPQHVRIRQTEGAQTFDFSAPLPAFAERRLALTGSKLPGTECLFSFRLHDQHVATAQAFLETYMWTRFVNDGGQK